MSTTLNELSRAIEDPDETPKDLFLSALSDNDDFVKWYAIKGIGLKRLREAVPHLLDLLGEPAPDLGDTDVRRIAAWSLGQIGFDELEKWTPDLGQRLKWNLRGFQATVFRLTPLKYTAPGVRRLSAA